MADANVQKCPVHQAWMRVSGELLADVLLPKGGRILSARQSVRHACTIELLVEHPRLPEVREGERLLEISPLFGREWRTDDPNELPLVTLTDWGTGYRNP